MVLGEKLGFFIVLLVLIAFPSSVSGADNRVCRQTPHGQDMDFWLGNWRAVDPATFKELGRNSLKISLDGCAIEEHWQGADGFEGKSLFYFEARKAQWHQIWVSGDTAITGGLKNKRQLTDYGGSGVRFSGLLVDPAAGQIIDRTTVSNLGDGRLRQLIEQSTDGGLSWKTIFDAYYLPLP